MKNALIRFVTQGEWIKRQALKSSNYLVTLISGFLIAKIGLLEASGLVSDETIAVASNAVSAVGVLVTAVVMIAVEALASWFAKSRVE